MNLSKQLERVIDARQKDLGGFSVRRILPYASHRMVGPFIFFDHMGPAQFQPGQGITVRPHPHINLSTVTYLFSGKIEHRDSLGNDRVIEPGAINWMTAGRGIVHSERTPEPLLSEGSYVNGIQCWVALPEKDEEMEPNFTHHPAATLPEFKADDAQIKLLLGSAFGRTSPVEVYSPLFYMDANISKGGKLKLPVDGQESAVYVVEGAIKIDGVDIHEHAMAVGNKGCDLEIEATADSRLMILGGESLGHREIFWNFVSSSKSRLEEVKAEWKPGPRKSSVRFPPIPGDDKEFIPLPEDQTKPPSPL